MKQTVGILPDDQYNRDEMWCDSRSAVYPVIHRRTRFWTAIMSDRDTIFLSAERGNLDRERTATRRIQTTSRIMVPSRRRFIANKSLMRSKKLDSTSNSSDSFQSINMRIPCKIMVFGAITSDILDGRSLAYHCCGGDDRHVIGGYVLCLAVGSEGNNCCYRS